jgi:hypothetical protein
VKPGRSWDRDCYHPKQILQYPRVPAFSQISLASRKMRPGETPQIVFSTRPTLASMAGAPGQGQVSGKDDLQLA